LLAGAQEGEKYALFPVLYDRSVQERRIEEKLDRARRLEREMDLRRPDLR
jgi:hypothetical protein